MKANTQRLDKYLANLGIASRRTIKRLLKDEYLTVNDDRVTESGVHIDPESDIIRLNGSPLKQPKLIYYILNKPKGYISTTADEYGRKNVLSLIPTDKRIYPVGRLDKDTTGLILLTNDGELTHKLTHPKFHVHKVYHLIVEGTLHATQLHALRTGVLLDDGITAPAKVKVLKENRDVSHVEMTIYEGRNRQIRRMCETVGLKLLDLKRIQFGPIHIDTLKEGKYRVLSQIEIDQLKKITRP